MLLHVTDARYQEGYKIWIRFDDGTEGTVDLESELKGPVFEPLKDPETFRQFHVDRITKTIVWANGADLAPEFLRAKVA